MNLESHYLSMIESLSTLLVKQGEEIFSLRDAQRAASNAPGNVESLSEVYELTADNAVLNHTIAKLHDQYNEAKVAHADALRSEAMTQSELARVRNQLDETHAELAKVRAEHDRREEYHAQAQKDLERANAALVSFIGNPDSFSTMIATIRATEVTYFDSYTQSERYNWIPRVKALREAFPGHFGLKNCKLAVEALTLHDEAKVRDACASFASGGGLSYDPAIERSSTHTDDID